MKIDLIKTNKDEYRATTKPILVDVKPAHYIAIDGIGEPGGSAFEEKIAPLYAMAYALKFAGKAAGRDYIVSKLEGLYGIDDQLASNMESVPRDQWKWRLLIRQPDFVDDSVVNEVRDKLRSKGKEGDFDAVRLVEIDEGLCVQILHVGPYGEIESPLDAMHAFVSGEGHELHGWHHEIYLSDPRRVPPERLRTLLRLQVK